MNYDTMYERDIHKSYMKISIAEEICYDERLILGREIEGTISFEKNFLNGQGQYWYDITGKQALDSFCNVHKINMQFFEMLILRICNQLELLEWNLINANCLMLQPEFIFFSNNGEDVTFALYPQNEGSVFESLQNLMEYLLSKLDHSDKDGVHMAYEIYEETLKEGFSIEGIKKYILSRRVEILPEESILSVEEVNMPAQKMDEESENSIYREIEKKWTRIWKKIKEILQDKVPYVQSEKKNKEDYVPEVVYPDEIEEKEMITIHPTVCLGQINEEAKGILSYEGIEGYPDFEIGQLMCVVGKSHRVKLQIDKETISQFHAKIDYIEGAYYIEDMNSTNGTYVNDKILNYKERKLLKVGDIVRFADVKYRFL